MGYTKKKILVFSDWFVPGFKAGGPIRSLFHITQNVNHDFYVVTRNTDYHSQDVYENVETGQWNRISNNCSVFYLPEKELTSSRIGAFIDEVMPEWIYLNSLFSPLFTLKPLRVLKRRRALSKAIVAPRGMLKSGALSIKSKKKKAFIYWAKLYGTYKGVKWHATNPEEVREIKMTFGEKSNVFLAPVLSSIAKENLLQKNKERGKIKLISLSRISPEKGILEAINFVKSLPNEYSVVLDIYGAIPQSDYVENCLLSIKNSNHAIELKGEVNPIEIPKLLGAYHFFILPTWGENFGHAIAESLVNGVPVIISDKTPWRKLEEQKAGWEGPLTSEHFIQVLTKAILMDNEEYKDWVKGAKELGFQQTNSEWTVKQNELLFE